MPWIVLDEQAAVLAFEYAFTKGAYATSMAFRGPEGLVVVSPPSGLTEADFAFLEPFGEVVALIANNNGHHLGQASWRERFPAAKSYAAPAILADLAKKSVFEYHDVADLPLGPAAQIHILQGFKQGELLVSAKGTNGSVWYTGDLLTNVERMPGPPIRWLFTWSGSAPGFRIFRLAIWFFVQDKAALRAHVERLVRDDPPVMVVPGHGPPLTDGDVATQVKTQLATL